MQQPITGFHQDDVQTNFNEYPIYLVMLDDLHGNAGVQAFSSPIVVKSVRYLAGKGNEVKSCLAKP